MLERRGRTFSAIFDTGVFVAGVSSKLEAVRRSPLRAAKTVAERADIAVGEAAVDCE